MSISIDPQLCSQLRRLDKYDNQTLDKLCMQTFDFLKNGFHLDSLQDEDPKATVRESMILIVQALKFGLSDSELGDLLSNIECNAYYREQLVQHYERYKSGLAKVLLAYSANCDNRYVHLQWKLEVKVASKYMREQLVPLVVLRLQTTNHAGKAMYFDLQCSVADIYHMVEQLEDALRRNNSQHCIKLLRHLK